MNLIKLSFSTLALSSLLFASNYKIDSNTSKAEFSTKYLKTQDVKGEFNKIVGEFNFDEKKSLLTSLKGEININSLSTSKNDLTAFIISEKIFDSIFGDLTIKNVTKNIELDFENSGEFFGKVYLKLSGKIKRSYFDLTWDELLDTGSSALDNEIAIEIDIEAEKQEKLKFTKIIEKSSK